VSARPILLVHGAWHGAWCWSALQAELDRRGVPSYAVDMPGHGASPLPLGDLHGDARVVADCLTRLGDDVVVVGHSFGGAVITQATEDAANVAHLVYLTAFTPDVGESVTSLLRSLPTVPSSLGRAIQARDDGTSVLTGDEAIVSGLYGACPPKQVAAAIARLSPQTMLSFNQPVTAAAWRSITSTYVTCTEDQAIPLVHQRLMAQRCTASRSLHTDHSPFMSAVGDTADILEDISRS
jgi:pimeloyl-ACP methyl ester carboxylesterase